MKKLVVIGGGHGLSTILKGAKSLDNVDISAIVTVADDGGSTGRIRKRYYIPAMGDIRNVLVALSSEEELMSDLMNYRFEGREELDVVGHNLGNLILTALNNMTGSFVESIKIASKMLNVKGKVIPSSLEYLSLCALMDDGVIVKGEANIPSLIHRIEKVFYDHEVVAYKNAIEEIVNADLIIYGIGSLYTSILPNTIIPDINKALNNSKAKKIYFANCMSQSNETYNYDLTDHLKAFEKHHTPVDMVIKHNNIIPKNILERYEAENSIEVINNGAPIEVREFDLLKFDNDLVRHDDDKIKKVLEQII